MSDDRSLYRDKMRNHYRSENIASEYNHDFSDQGSFRHRLIAGRERKTVLKLLQQVPHNTVLDLPSGTGKLAPVFKKIDAYVLACDISSEMLYFAQKRYAEHEYHDVEFIVCDGESAASCFDMDFNVAVCLRLLHRVPEQTKQRILSELAAIADHAIISFGITSTYHTYRRKLRRRILGGDNRPDWYLSESAVVSLLEEQFVIEDSLWILPGLSQEKIYLCTPKAEHE